MFNYKKLPDLLEIAAAKNEPPFILILDGIEDPQNFGAILRTAEAAGVHGVVIRKNRQVQVTETVIKVSTG
ncbi:MAG: TrmH family RNA methyltransferase, partial [Candidatus Margulisiibacteriota bacterium]